MTSSSPTSARFRSSPSAIDGNVRALEGALIRVVAFGSLTGRPLTAELAREVLDSLYPRAAIPRTDAKRTIGDIQTAVASTSALSREELLSPRRTARIAWPRQVAMYLARELTRRVAARDREAVRRARPHDRAARMAAHERAYERQTPQCAPRSSISPSSSTEATSSTAVIHQPLAH